MMFTLIMKPDEEISGNQHHSKVDSNGRLKIEGFEECCGIGDQKKQRGGQVGGQKLIHDASLEHNLHFDAIRDNIRIKVIKRPFLSKFWS